MCTSLENSWHCLGDRSSFWDLGSWSQSDPKIWWKRCWRCYDTIITENKRFSSTPLVLVKVFEVFHNQHGWDCWVFVCWDNETMKFEEHFVHAWHNCHNFPPKLFLIFYLYETKLFSFIYTHLELHNRNLAFELLWYWCCKSPVLDSMFLVVMTSWPPDLNSHSWLTPEMANAVPTTCELQSCQTPPLHCKFSGTTKVFCWLCQLLHKAPFSAPRCIKIHWM